MRYFLVITLALLCSSLFAADEVNAMVKSDSRNWLITVGGEQYTIPKTVDMEVAVEAAKQSYRGVKPVKPEPVAATFVPTVQPVPVVQTKIVPAVVFNPLAIASPAVVCRT